MSKRNRTSAARRRAATERNQRRETLGILLARMQRGVLTPDEADRTVGIVTRELADAEVLRRQVDAHRRAEAAALRRAEAADAAIVEAEQDRDQARHEVKQWRAAYGPDALNTYRAALDRAEQAEAILGRAHRALAAILAKPGETPLDELTEYAAQTLTRNGERIIDAEQRAERVEAELAAARVHAAEQRAAIRRLLANLRDAEQQAADIRKAYTQADALATLRGVQRDAARDTLRATENDLADTRRRLANRSEPRCDVATHTHLVIPPGPDCIREHAEETHP